MESTEITALIRRQSGLVTRAQAGSLGISRATVRHASRPGGRWQSILPGVYAAFTGPIDDAQRIRAASLYGGDLAAISGAAACRMIGLRYVPTDDRIVIVLPMPFRRMSSGFVHVVRTDRAVPVRLMHPEQSTPGGARIPITVAAPARAVLDAARGIGLRISHELPHRANGTPILTTRGATAIYHRALQDVRALICESVQRGRAPLPALQAELDQGARQGSVLARRAIADAVAGCRSAPECELRDLVATSHLLPAGRWNLPLPDYPHMRPDLCWLEARLVVEVDSIEWHRLGDAPERTERRRALLASLGWTVLPVSPTRLRHEPDVVLTEIVAAYQAGLAR